MLSPSDKPVENTVDYGRDERLMTAQYNAILVKRLRGEIDADKATRLITKCQEWQYELQRKKEDE
jgi:hypothetical protein